MTFQGVSGGRLGLVMFTTSYSSTYYTTQIFQAISQIFWSLQGRRKDWAVAYRLQLPARARIHDVFHIALLKKFEGTPPEATVPLPPMQHGWVIPIPAKIIQGRLNRATWELLVSWQDRPTKETSWEQVEIFKLNYPDIQLVDKLFLGEEGNVIDAFVGRNPGLDYKGHRKNHLVIIKEESFLSGTRLQSLWHHIHPPVTNLLRTVRSAIQLTGSITLTVAYTLLTTPYQLQN
jgi:hypothetical protein